MLARVRISFFREMLVPLGELVRHWRESQGLIRAALAARAGVSEVQVQQWEVECSGWDASESNLEALEEWLGIPAEELEALLGG